MKMQYTEEQIAKANQTDLVSFLNAQGEQLVKSGKEYRWKKHDSVTVSGNRWYRHSQGRGGYPVDFVMEFYNATFPEAVKMLTGEQAAAEAKWQERRLRFEEERKKETEPRPISLRYTLTGSSMARLCVSALAAAAAS